MIDALFGARRLHAVVAAADRIERADVPGDALDGPREHAAAARALAVLGLMHIDAGLALAEVYL